MIHFISSRNSSTVGRAALRIAAPAVAVALLVSACGSTGTDPASAAGDAGKSLIGLRIGAPATAVSGLSPELGGPVGWAVHEGKAQPILAKYGYTYDGFAGFVNGPPAAQALASGSIQLATIGDAPAILARSAGQTNRAISITTSSGIYWIAARTGGPTSIDQLAGKKVGVQFGSNFDHYLRYVLDQHHLTDKVTLVNLAMGDGYAALISGAIDAYSATSGLAATWAQKGGITIIDKAEQSHPDYKSASVTLVNQSFLDKHPNIQQAWWAVYDEGQQLIKQDPDAYLTWTAKQSGETLATAKETTILSYQDRPVTDEAITAAEGTEQFLTQQKLAKQSFSISDWAVRSASGS